MPTFYRPANRRQELGSVVWNPKANAVLADFSQGNLFKTDDSYVIQKLRELGYPTVEDYETSTNAPSPPPHELKPQPAARVGKPQQPAVAPPSAPPKGKAPVKKGAVQLKKRTAPSSPDSMDSDVSPSKR